MGLVCVCVEKNLLWVACVLHSCGICFYMLFVLRLVMQCARHKVCLSRKLEIDLISNFKLRRDALKIMSVISECSF